MRAAQVTMLDGPGSVEIRDDVTEPEPTADEILVEVAAAGINFPDVLQTRGEYQVRPDLPFTPGSEFAGTVLRTPPGTGFAVGDRVMGINGAAAGDGGSGTFAEVATGVGTRMVKLPVDMSFADAAGIPMNVFTADFALRVRGALRPGETVLVHGAGGGLGQALIQVAVAMGASAIGVVSSDEKARVATAAGAQHTVAPDGFREAVADLTAGRGVDLIADPVGGDRFTDSLRSLARGGRVLVLGFTGRDIPTVRVNRLLLRNIGVLGVGWGEAVRGNPEVMREQWQVMAEWAEQGLLSPAHRETFPLDEVATALRRMDERQTIGKVVLTLR